MRSVYFSFFLLEFKKWMGYRIDFWLQLFANLFVEVALAYFLWDSIFSSQNVSYIGGFTFEQMLTYYILGSFIGKIVRTGDEMQFSREIYEGTITKFLLYPVSTLWLKLVVKSSYSTLTYSQFLICIFVLPFLLPSFHLDFFSLFVGTYILIFSIILSYLLNVMMEIAAFWAENVWALVVLMRFACQFLGGSLLPLSLFPESVQKILFFTPFPYTFYVPTKMMMGEWSLQLFIEAQVIAVFWIAVLSGLATFMWRRGQLLYTGVGQ